MSSFRSGYHHLLARAVRCSASQILNTAASTSESFVTGNFAEQLSLGLRGFRSPSVTGLGRPLHYAGDEQDLGTCGYPASGATGDTSGYRVFSERPDFPIPPTIAWLVLRFFIDLLLTCFSGSSQRNEREQS